MKDIFATVGKILGYIFAAAVITFTSWMTWLLAQRLIPDNTILQAMTLVLFDLAALVWFIQFISQAKGTTQWAISGIGFMVGLAGAIIMAAGELMLGQQLVVLEDPTTLGWVLVATVIIAALAHATLVYLFHFTDPAVKNRIENAQQVSKAIEKAYADARSEIERHNQELTASLRASVMYEAQQQIAGATAAHIRGAVLLEERAGETLRGGLVIPGSLAAEAPAMPGPARQPRRWPWRSGKASPGDLPKASDPSEAARLLAELLALGIDPAALLALLAAKPQPKGQYAQDTIDVTEEARKNGRMGEG